MDKRLAVALHGKREHYTYATVVIVVQYNYPHLGWETCHTFYGDEPVEKILEDFYKLWDKPCYRLAVETETLVRTVIAHGG